MDKSKKQIDQDDLNNEIAGRETGRIKRFFSQSADPMGSEHQDEDEFAFSAMSQILAERHQAFQRRIAELQARLDQLDQASLVALQEAEENLRQIRDNANQDVDGRFIYKSRQDGNIYYENGAAVSADDIDLSDWRDNAPDFETFNRANDALAHAEEARSKVLEQQTRLEDDPDSDELDDIEAELDLLEAEFPNVPIDSPDLQKGSLLSTPCWRHNMKESRQVG